MAKYYVGTGNFSQSTDLLNSIPTKHSLSGDGLTAFNDCKAILDLMKAHFQAGGTKFNLPVSNLNTLKTYANNNVAARVRGQARAILAIYGILYPPEKETAMPRSNQMLDKQNSTNSFVDIYPNPANQLITLVFSREYEQLPIPGFASLYNPQGQLILSKKIKTNDNLKEINLSNIENGFYYLQIKLEDGKTTTQSVVIVH